MYFKDFVHEMSVDTVHESVVLFSVKNFPFSFERPSNIYSKELSENEMLRISKTKLDLGAPVYRFCPPKREHV